MDDKSLFIISKDNPDNLRVCLPVIANLEYEKILIDDSLILENQNVTRKLCDLNNVHYHGPKEQKSIFGKELTSCQKFISKLGSPGWTLGKNRNYILLLGFKLGLNRIIMMDDDILITDASLVDVFFKTLEKELFVGCDINCMPDDSIVGHIFRAGGIIQCKYVSGGFLGVNLKHIKHYFTNIYNEDWIWLFFESKGKHIKSIGSVDQLLYNPFNNYTERVKFQEFGEICWDGLYKSDLNALEKCLTDYSYWKKIIKKRVEEIKKISNLSIPYHLKYIACKVQDTLLTEISNYSPEILSSFFKLYFQNIENWNFVKEKYII